MYVYGAKTGKLLWARPLGTYIYGAAAVYKRKVFVGTYDGKFYALDAATGDVAGRSTRTARSTRRADGDGRPRLLRGLLELRLRGVALRGARAGRHLRGSRARRHAGVALPGGKYANPVVADEDRIYLTGRAGVYALARKGSKAVKEYLRRDREKRQSSR